MLTQPGFSRSEDQRGNQELSPVLGTHTLTIGFAVLRYSLQVPAAPTGNPSPMPAQAEEDGSQSNTMEEPQRQENRMLTWRPRGFC